MESLLLTNINQLLTMRGADGPRRGGDLRQVGLIEDAAVLCAGGRIVSVGTRKEANRDAWLKNGSVIEVDCRGGVVLPGFVDSHTHPAFMQPRLVDFEKRIEGATYEEIAEAGGGIRSSIAGVREAKRKELAEKVVAALNQMSAEGTTTVEAKSGYGLSAESEIKSLEAIRDSAKKWPGTLVPTLLGAHVVPPEYKGDPDEYVRVVCEELIPQVAKKKLAKFVDVFCERGAFSLEQSERILAAAVSNGLETRAHVWQLSPAKLDSLYEYKPASFDHLDFMDDADIATLAKSDTVATLVPGANFFLGLKQYPPARKLIDAGAAVALATDFNPGTSPTVSMPFVLSLACTHMKMTPAEGIAAATINGAWSLRMADRKGSVEPGKDADLAIFGVKDYREIPYWFASETCSGVMMNGELRLKV
ncbi:MAG TPA: imidazolonepropionase [Terriglobales bacterium]|nr:imidazolonepropionase [Terriglobales bacterium]